MKMGILFVLVVVLLLMSLWIYGFVQANDFSVQTREVFNVHEFKKVLLIFPHADDEAQSSAGFISRMSNSGVEMYWLLLTQGERGTADAAINDELRVIRSEEAKEAARIYGVKNVIQKDYPDNNVGLHKERLVTDLKRIIGEISPDLVITYDESGLYGHSDHIVTSQVTTKLLHDDYPEIKLWYISSPKKLLDKISLPEHMASDSNFKSKRRYPNFKVWVGISGVLNKIRSVYAYKSQFDSFKEGLPIKQIPLWFYVSLTPYEYFYEVR